jgi:hypothetical protein
MVGTEDASSVPTIGASAPHVRSIHQDEREIQHQSCWNDQ